jgi:hypothetical protein
VLGSFAEGPTLLSNRYFRGPDESSGPRPKGYVCVFSTRYARRDVYLFVTFYMGGMFFSRKHRLAFGLCVLQKGFYILFPYSSLWT